MNNNENCPMCQELFLDKYILNNNFTINDNYDIEMYKFINSTKTTEYKLSPNHINKFIFIGKKFIGQKVLYWSSDPEISNRIINKGEAYLKFNNYGVSRINSHGYIRIHLQIPQNYKNFDINLKREIYYPKHFNFVISNNMNTIWDLNNIYSQLLILNYKFQQFIKIIKEKKTIVINSSEYSEYAIEHIPNTFSLPYTILLTLNNNEIIIWLKKVINKNYPYFHHLLDKEDTSLYINIPIIVYNNDVNQSKLVEQYCCDLIKQGYINVSNYLNGITEYKKHTTKNSSKKKKKYIFKSHVI